MMTAKAMTEYLYCPGCDMMVRHFLRHGKYICQNCGNLNPYTEEQKIAPKCPSCGETTNQHLRGWEESYMKYRCGHCKKAYKEAKP